MRTLNARSRFAKRREIAKQLLCWSRRGSVRLWTRMRLKQSTGMPRYRGHSVAVAHLLEATERGRATMIMTMRRVPETMTGESGAGALITNLSATTIFSVQEKG